MKNLFFISVLLFNCFYLKSQNTPIYGWQEHLSYNNAVCIAEIKNNIYCGTKNGVFYYNKDDYTLNRLNKITGLSDVGVSSISYDSENDIILIVYNNANVDLVKNDVVVNLPDIKNKIVIGEKRINNSIIENGIAYLSSSLGLILIDLNNEEIKDTYKIGEDANFLEIVDCAINDSSIFVATTDGCYYADKNSNVLFNYNSWSKIDGYNGYINDITITNSEIIISSPDPYYSSSFYNNTLIHAGRDFIKLYFSNNSDSTIIYNNLFTHIQDIIIDKDNIIWAADSLNSLIKIEDLNYVSIIKPNGPSSNSIKKISYENERLTVLHNTFKNSISHTSDLIEWETVNSIEYATCSKYNTKNTYYGSSNNGLFRYNDSINIVQYSQENTNGNLDNSDNIISLITDNSNNLWGTKTQTSHPLFCKSSDDNWYSYNMPFVANSSTEIGEIIIDNHNQKWGILKGNGIFVYDDKGTLSNNNDDEFIKINTSVGNGNLPDKQVYCIANDLNGDLWVGTKTGVCIFYSPSSVFSGYNFDAQQIIVEDNGFGQYLLNSEIVYSIEIDGANRKWIGTLGSGLFLISDDGYEQIYHFTKDNSPLISNTILDLSINNSTGEIYIATDKGLMSFRGDATNGDNNSSELNIFPNPVREGFNGSITIEGLSFNSNVKITDISGNLVFETISNGGTAVWNGYDNHNEKVNTGIYLIFSSSQSQKNGPIGKILFIR